jgi:hypothetical protein
MSKLTYRLGNSDRVFEFVRGDRKALEKEFCGTSDFPGLFEWVYKKVFPLDENQKPTMGGNYEAQVAFVHAAVKQHWKVKGKEVTRDMVEKCLDDISESEDDLVLKPVTVALAAAWEQGLFGRKLKMTVEDDEAPKEAGSSEVSS